MFWLDQDKKGEMTGGSFARDMKDGDGVTDSMKENLQTMAHKAGCALRDLAGSAGDNIGDAAETVRSRIQEKPVQSSAIAFGIGLLVGALLHRGPVMDEAQHRQDAA